MNVFDKPDEQSQACLSSAMARKGAMKMNGALSCGAPSQNTRNLYD